MAPIVANRPMWVAIIAALLVVGCSADKSAVPSVAAVASSNPSPSASPTSAASATPTVIPTPSPTPLPTPTAIPVAADWSVVPAQPSVKNLAFQDVVWTGTRFVAVAWGVDGSGTLKGGVFLDSPDGGVTWHRQTSDAATRLATGPGGIVAVGKIHGQRASWTSVDGLTWAPHPDAFPPAPDGSSFGEDSVEVTDVVASGNGWLAVGRRDPFCMIDCGADPIRAYAWTSADGARWTRVTDQKAFQGGGMNTVAHGSDGFIAAGIASGHAAVWTSADGLAWSRVPDASMFHDSSSPDGPLPVEATGVAARDGVIVVVGTVEGQDYSRARAWWSADGRTWAKASVGAAADGAMSSVAATPRGFLAVGGSLGCAGGVWASTDGRTWRCDLTDPRAKGFGPDAAAGSDSVDVAVGSTEPGDDDASIGWSSVIWSRPWR